VLELIESAVACAEAEDHKDPVWAAMSARGRTMFGSADPAHAEAEMAWRDYQEIRQTRNLAAIDAAPTRWRVEFVGWFQQLAERRAAEDEQHAQELRRRQDDSQRLDPGDAFPKPGSRAAELVRASRERERRAAISRDQMRGQPGPGGWRPAGGRRA